MENQNLEAQKSSPMPKDYYTYLPPHNQATTDIRIFFSMLKKKNH